MRVAFEQHAVLEGAGLAFVDVHGHQARRRLGEHDAPFATGREARTAQAAQARVLERLDHRLEVARAGVARLQQRVATGRPVGGVVDVAFGQVPRGDRGHLCQHRVAARVRHRVLAHDRRGRLLAAADAGRREHAHVTAQQLGQPLQQLARARHLARQAVADTHGQRGRRGLAFLHDVEVVVEAGDLEHLGLRQAHLLRERREVGRRQVAETVLDLVQVLDQQVARTRLRAEQVLHFLEGAGVDAATLRRLALALLRDLYIQRSDGDDATVHSGSVCSASAALRSRARRAASPRRPRCSRAGAAPRRCVRRAAASASPRSGCPTS